MSVLLAVAAWRGDQFVFLQGYLSGGEIAQSLQGEIFYGATYFMTFFTGLTGLALTVAAMQGALNSDSHHKCEIFYRSLPIPAWQFCLSRFVVILSGIWASVLVLSIFNYLLVNALFARVMGFTYSWYGLVALAQSYMLVFLLFGLLCGSFFFFWSAVFKEHAFLKVMLVFLAAEAAVSFMNNACNWSLPHPGYILRTIDASLEGVFRLNQSNLLVGGEVKDFIFANWKAIFSLGQLIHLAASVGFFMLGMLVYRQREHHR